MNDDFVREVADLQRAAATKDAEAQEQALSAEVEARKQVETALAEAEARACREQEALAAQIAEHEKELSQTQKQADRFVFSIITIHGIIYNY